jgi:hypothetical protein
VSVPTTIDMDAPVIARHDVEIRYRWMRCRRCTRMSMRNRPGRATYRLPTPTVRSCRATHSPGRVTDYVTSTIYDVTDRECSGAEPATGSRAFMSGSSNQPPTECASLRTSPLRVNRRGRSRRNADNARHPLPWPTICRQPPNDDPHDRESGLSARSRGSRERRPRLHQFRSGAPGVDSATPWPTARLTPGVGEGRFHRLSQPSSNRAAIVDTNRAERRGQARGGRLRENAAALYVLVASVRAAWVCVSNGNERRR